MKVLNKKYITNNNLVKYAKS